MGLCRCCPYNISPQEQPKSVVRDFESQIEQIQNENTMTSRTLYYDVTNMILL